MSELHEKLMGEVKKHLPQLVGAELQEVLEQAKKDAAEVKDLKERLDAQIKKVGKLEVDLSVAKALNKRADDLDAQARAQEVRAAVMLEREVSMAARLADLKEVTLAVFANSRFKYSESGSVPLMMPGQNGCQPYVASGAVTKHAEGTS